MKALCLTTMIVVFLLISSNPSQAQTTQTKLNQVELMKQLVGSWTWRNAKDTIVNFSFKSVGSGEDCDFKCVTKGKTIMEGKQLWGYVKGIDKFIVAGINEKPDIEISAVWFTSKYKYVIIPFSDISNPEKASFKVEGDIKSPDIFTETTIVNDKPVKTDTWTRVKE
jgi:hypothetical protein